MGMRRFIASAAIAGAIVLSGCGSASPAAPSGTLTGVWSGTLTIGGDDRRTRWELTQTGAAVAGRWSVTYEDGRPEASGSVGGTAVGSAASLSLARSEPIACAAGTTLSGTITVTGTVAGDRLTGTHFTFTCEGAVSGTVDVSRE